MILLPQPPLIVGTSSMHNQLNFPVSTKKSAGILIGVTFFESINPFGGILSFYSIKSSSPGMWDVISLMHIFTFFEYYFIDFYRFCSSSFKFILHFIILMLLQIVTFLILFLDFHCKCVEL